MYVKAGYMQLHAGTPFTFHISNPLIVERCIICIVDKILLNEPRFCLLGIPNLYMSVSVFL
jgi:hypothetical protein